MVSSKVGRRRESVLLLLGLAGVGRTWLGVMGQASSGVERSFLRYAMIAKAGIFVILLGQQKALDGGASSSMMHGTEAGSSDGSRVIIPSQIMDGSSIRSMHKRANNSYS